MSGVHDVNMDAHTREVAGIPESACCFAWCHGCAQSESGNRLSTEQAALSKVGIELQKPLHAFLISGGFVYFSRGSKSLVAVNAAFPDIEEESQLMDNGEKWYNIEFDSPPQKVPSYIDLSNRWVTPTDSAIIKQGGTLQCWLLPNEVSSCPMGGFAYRLSEKMTDAFGATDVFFPCIVSN